MNNSEHEDEGAGTSGDFGFILLLEDCKLFLSVCVDGKLVCAAVVYECSRRVLLDLDRFGVPDEVGELWESIFERGDGDLNGNMRTFGTWVELPLCTKDGLIVDKVYVLGSTPFFHKCDVFEVVEED